MVVVVLVVCLVCLDHAALCLLLLHGERGGKGKARGVSQGREVGGVHRHQVKEGSEDLVHLLGGQAGGGVCRPWGRGQGHV